MPKEGRKEGKCLNEEKMKANGKKEKQKKGKKKKKDQSGSKEEGMKLNRKKWIKKKRQINRIE